MALETSLHQPGLRVRVTQQIPTTSKKQAGWTSAVEGTIVAAHRAQTGSWFAHAKGDRLWLDRLELRRDDGEIVVLNLDRYSSIELLGGSAGAADGSAA